MLQHNQIKRLILHTQEGLDILQNQLSYAADDETIAYRKGFIAGLKLVLEMDPATINNKPINYKENDNDNVRQNGSKR